MCGPPSGPIMSLWRALIYVMARHRLTASTANIGKQCQHTKRCYMSNQDKWGYDPCSTTPTKPFHHLDRLSFLLPPRFDILINVTAQRFNAASVADINNRRHPSSQTESTSVATYPWIKPPFSRR